MTLQFALRGKPVVMVDHTAGFTTLGCMYGCPFELKVAGTIPSQTGAQLAPGRPQFKGLPEDYIWVDNLPKGMPPGRAYNIIKQWVNHYATCHASHFLQDLQVGRLLGTQFIW